MTLHLTDVPAGLLRDALVFVRLAHDRRFVGAVSSSPRPGALAARGYG